MEPRRNEPLAPRTTLRLGGPAEHFVEADSRAALQGALAWARGRGMPVTILGGGSNVLVPDEGVPGLVIALRTRGEQVRVEGDSVTVALEAGESWDEFVARATARGWAGVECLAGIPGLVGATPMQNVGAYGQEVADVIERVEVVRVADSTPAVLAARDCAFAYRHSRFKDEPGRWVVTAVHLRLRVRGAGTIRYGELTRALAGTPNATPADVREAVLRLRRAKSMVLDDADPNRRSVGSFFTNPIVTSEGAAEVVRRALAAGVARDASDVPQFPEADGRVKLAAGWLIERSGIQKGLRRGAVGVSTAHALQLVHHGGGTTAELLALASEVAGSVREAFGVELEREPVLLGAALTA